MGQQHRKVTKRRRRHAYLKRQKEIRRNSRTTPTLARKVLPVSTAEKEEEAAVKPAVETTVKEPVKKESAAKKTTAKTATEKPKKAPAKKSTAVKSKEEKPKKAPAKKASAKKTTAKKEDA